MKTNTILTLAALVLLGGVCRATAQGTAFTYQGRLNDGANPANGTYDLRFTIYDLPGAFGTVIAGPLTNSATIVSNGLFTVTLDFGAGVFTGASRWLEVGVRTNASTNVFSTLNPRQALTATPYAITAGNVTGTINGATITDGTLTASKFATNQVVTSLNLLRDDVTLAAGANVVLSTNGHTLTITANSGGGSGTNGWLLTGNAGTAPPANFVGTTDNQPLQLHVGGSQAFRLEPAFPGPNVIGGPAANSVNSGGSIAIAGGLRNTVRTSTGVAIGGGVGNSVNTADYSVIGGGGGGSIANANYSLIGGGAGNTIQIFSPYSVVAGGSSNAIELQSWSGTISGGTNNIISAGAPWSVIGGGANNLNIGYGATVGGGTNNIIVANLATVSGGTSNSIGNNSSMGTIGGGSQNKILNDSLNATIGGGFNNFILNQSSSSFIGGGASNTIGTNSPGNSIAGGQGDAIGPNALSSTIGGGLNNTIVSSSSSGGLAYSSIGGGGYNSITTSSGTIAGGFQNSIISNASGGFIGGGGGNAIHIGGSAVICGGSYNRGSADYASIGGGYNNANLPAATYGVIAGGTFNLNSTYGSAIGGGSQNLVKPSTNTFISLQGFSTIAGGTLNVIQADHGAISGGLSNAITSQDAAICGGVQNTILGLGGAGAFIGGGANNAAFGSYSSIMGGSGNTTGGGASYATVAGGVNNLASGIASFAAGQGAQATNEHTFVWSDGSSGVPFTSTTPYQFLVSASLGVGINKNNPLYTLDVAGTVHADGNMYAQAFMPSSDRNAKEKFVAIDTRDILERVAGLPISTWNFKQDANARHIGPMAQDFKTAFDLGADDKHIATVDADGVALAAIQGLNQKLEEALKQKEVEIQDLRQRNSSLERRFDELQKTLRMLAGKD